MYSVDYYSQKNVDMRIKMIVYIFVSAFIAMVHDIVVLGANGFTGQLVVKCLAKLSDDVKWLITARSKDKIKGLVDNLGSKGVNIKEIPTRIVEANDNESLNSALQDTKLVLNCIGPYTNLSEPIIEACIKLGVHYIDLSAESYHILNLYVKYHKLAEAANVLILPSCGFASIVTASGLLYLKQQFDGTLRSAECYTELDVPKRTYIPFVDSLASYGTWNSLVHVLRHLKEYLRLKEDIHPAIELPEDMKRNFFHWRRRKLWFPYPGPDEDVIEISQRFLQEKRQERLIYLKHYTTMPLFIHFLIIPAMFIYFYLSYFNWFANLLWRFPQIFTLGYISHKGPSDKTRNDTKCNFTYIGKGWDRNLQDISKLPDKEVKVKVSTKDLYETSALVMIAAAITVLKEQQSMPSGGVINVGAAFNDTTIIERFMNNGIKYEVIT